MWELDNKKRTIIQVITTLIQNANFKGFFTGKIYTGQTKQVCVPGLNCYSCPGAVGACPIGSLQNTLSGLKFKFPYYVLGLLIFFGTVLGRIVCGFLCPFGLVQDLLYKIPFYKKIKEWKGDRILRYLKYVILVVCVIALPILYKLTPFFCKYICPSGTIAGILLSLADHSLFQVFGKIFTWKLSVLVLIVICSILIYRPFCKYLCPLGAFYGLFNKVSVISMKLDKDKCINCKVCYNACDMCVDPSEKTNSAECIRCGKCINACPKQALSMGVKNK
ncbi:MAG: 4Fe-4S binding protein [Lachnospiraceae bacterium]|nr:4Fe-4S binding protein [Lachnospiraceae bacterium]